MIGRDPRTLSVLVAAALFAAALVWSLAYDAEPARLAGGGPTAEELDSLRRYLAPVAPAPTVDDYEMYLPASEPPRPAPRGAPAAQRVDWRLSAILITGRQRVAIINERPVRPGDRLSDGSRVVSIERDRVVLEEPSGPRRILTVTSALEKGST